jgi:hypothetical protein
MDAEPVSIRAFRISDQPAFVEQSIPGHGVTVGVMAGVKVRTPHHRHIPEPGSRGGKGQPEGELMRFAGEIILRVIDENLAPDLCTAWKEEPEVPTQEDIVVVSGIPLFRVKKHQGIEIDGFEGPVFAPIDHSLAQTESETRIDYDFQAVGADVSPDILPPGIVFSVPQP